MKRTLLSLAVSAVALVAFPALADHEAYGAQPPPGQPSVDCDHAPPMHGAQSAQTGRYELQTVQKWTEGHYQQVWVPGQCRHRHHLRVCTAGYYQQQWVPGSYVNVQEWVWVPFEREYRYGRRGWRGGGGVRVSVGF